MNLNDAGLQLIKEFEGFRSNPYYDEAGVATIGYGSTYYEDGTKVTMQDSPIDQDRASQLMLNELNADFCPGVQALIKVTVTDNQFAALVDFAYNEGVHSLAESTAIRCLNAKNYQDCADALLLWNKVRVRGELVVDAGVVRRRQAERALFLS